MSKKQFSWLAILALLAVVTALFLPGDGQDSEALDDSLLLPGLEARVNELDWLRVTAAGGVSVATLKRGEGGWTVSEAGGYAADWGSLQALLSGLAAARVAEAKTTNPQYYARLGVEDVAQADAGGVMLSFSESSGLPAVILGTTAQGRGGQYARVAESGQSVLLDRELSVPTERSAWLDRAIVDISEAEVVQIDIDHADGEQVVARKASADDSDFTLLGVADGFEPKSNWTVNSLAGSLSALQLESVKSDDGVDWTGSSRFRLLTADGIDLEVELAAPVEVPGGTTEYWVRFSAGLYTTALGHTEDNIDAETASRERAEVINQRVEGWAYRLPQYKFNAMNKRMADLVQVTSANPSET